MTPTRFLVCDCVCAWKQKGHIQGRGDYQAALDNTQVVDLGV